MTGGGTFDTTGFVVIPSLGGTIVDCINGVVLRSLLLRFVVGGGIGVVDCFKGRTMIQITVRRVLQS